ncbi:ribose/xylose/arabinose/galactoside ABC-type transport system permease subunit [Rhizobium sp. BK077]|uniref:ABC transporter permease n=1 Tax=Rhizobium TaxID=379 RepID=UPI0007B52579|nr:MULTISPECIES: ABC transporter permease [Rhizobium]KZS49617.1 ribose ABC transporter permease [Rhizobium anhuiense bv. trifolii]MBB3297800.1 ribose/xylose/arabinose/galactoside ABC-type transport system permease subunit [Rhizobium sp. BK112]MBB3366804.1 ribose/xylose/arabinose/galactoside ABC-type transport system permease subunit [Rhizobium sp. BK077]MBB4177706.1 ribose/xylose/arabinose/galactoside ABC-type transport system permease subunit [Rhizobium sp. BK109]NKM57614.1 ribose ABC transpo
MKYLPRGTGLAGALIVLIIAASLISPHFLNPINILNVLRQVALYGILGIGMTFVILTKGIDLSVGSTVALVGVTGAVLMEQGMPIPLMVLICIAIGALVGCVNGFGISYFRIPAFIMTLGCMVMVRGFALMIADGGTVNPGKLADSFFVLGGGYMLGVPTPIYVFAAVCIIAAVVLSFTQFGRAIYAVGSNEEAARLSGINVPLVIFSVYIICGVLAALSGLIFLSRLSVGDPNSGLGLELEAITIAVIGGTSLFGGEGTVLGTIGGAMVLAIIANILNLAGVSPFSQQVVKGAIIVLAVLLEAGRKPRK